MLEATDGLIFVHHGSPDRIIVPAGDCCATLQAAYSYAEIIDQFGYTTTTTFTLFLRLSLLLPTP